MKKRQLIQLHNNLSTAKSKGNSKFRYAIRKNINVIKNDIEALTEVEKENYSIIQKFSEKRLTIYEKYGTQKQGTEPSSSFWVLDPSSENFKVATEELDALKTEFKEDIEAYDKKIVEFNDLLSEEVGTVYTFHEIQLEDIPEGEEKLTDEEYDSIMDWGILK